MREVHDARIKLAELKGRLKLDRPAAFFEFLIRRIGLKDVRIEGDEEFLYLDPFNGGVRLDTPACARLVQHTTGHTGAFNLAWLNPTGPRATLTRMLTNLRNIYVRSEAWAPALTAIHHLLATQPRLASHWRDLGLVHYRNDEIQKAIYCLEAYLLRDPEGSDSPQIAQRLHAIVQEYARQN